MSKNLVVLISGRGSNLKAILEAIKSGKINAKVSLVLSNKKDAKGLEIAKEYGIKTKFIDTSFFETRRGYDIYIAELIKKENGFNVVLVGSKEDLEMDKSIYPKEVLDLRGKITLRETIAVISQGLATVSNDSAIAHISRAVDIKVLMIYGSTHPYFGFAPLKDEGDYIFKNLPCQPCSLHGQNSCKYKTFECLTSIFPKEVYDKLKNLI